MSSVLRRFVRPVVAGALLGALAGCSEDSPRPPVVVVTPEPVRGVIAQTAFSGFQTDVWVAIDLVVSPRSKLDITVDWTAPDTWMYVYLGTQKCDYAQLQAGKCPFFVSSETQKPKPRVLFTENLDPGTYYLFLYNVPRDPRTGIGSDNTEAVSIQIGQTIGAAGRAPSEVVHLGNPAVVPAPRP